MGTPSRLAQASLFLGAILFLNLGIAAQYLKRIQQDTQGLPEVQLPTEVDDAGLKQWAPLPVQNCPNCLATKEVECMHCKHLETPKLCPECQVTRKAPCHVCAGTGALPNPLEQGPCPGCHGHGIFGCHLCGNQGFNLFQGSGKQPLKCAACKGKGGIPCGVCKGKRLVPSAFHGKLGDTPLKKVVETRDKVKRLQQEVEAFRIQGKPREDRKAFVELWKDVQSDLPVLKKFATHVEEVSKGLDQPIQDIQRDQMHAYDNMKVYLLYYLVHQERAMDQCIQRLEFNQKVKD